MTTKIFLVDFEQNNITPKKYLNISTCHIENFDLSTFGSISPYLGFTIPDSRPLSRRVSYTRYGNAVKTKDLEKGHFEEQFSRIRSFMGNCAIETIFIGDLEH